MGKEGVLRGRVPKRKRVSVSVRVPVLCFLTVTQMRDPHDRASKQAASVA